MKVITNKLKVTYNHMLIDEKYDIFQITTEEKYIPSGSYILDKPIDKLKALSLVFEYKARTCFVLFFKNKMTNYDLQEALENDRISVSKINSSQTFFASL